MNQTSEKTSLALVIHFHQPVGNLDQVVRAATDHCYRPFLETLEAFPGVAVTLHYSGCLLEWLEANAADVTGRLRKLTERGQVELMTGGFYEPVLAALPRRDQVGQINMLTRHLESAYGAASSGLWLTERVWEQDVAGALTEAGVRYTVVDDSMFHSVGVTDEELTGPFITDHESAPLLIYAGDRRLRYLIPYKRVDRVTAYLRDAGAGRLFVYADDGEKFGEWPGTHERVYEKGWLQSFFQELTDQSEWLKVTTLGDHAQSAVPRGRVYLPSSSYVEMMTWALPSAARLHFGAVRRKLESSDPEGILPFLRGAPWRSFLAKYPEVNHLQKRMLHVSKQVHEAGAPPEAITELYRAQCNCAYWHGAFGGTYISFMRSALWHHLMRAEELVHDPGADIHAHPIDIDADAREEILLTAPWGIAVISPHRGGRLIELDEWSVGANLLATMARHQEAYHLGDENPSEEIEDDEMAAAQASAELDRDNLVFDDDELGALVDHINGRRVDESYEYALQPGGAVTLRASHEGLAIEKTISVNDTDLVCRYEVRNESGDPWTGTFSIENSILPLNLGREARPDDVAITSAGWKIAQPEAEVAAEADVSPAADITASAIETASATLEGLQTMHQGTKVVVSWEIRLEAGEAASFEHRMRAVIAEGVRDKKERGVSA